MSNKDSTSSYLVTPPSSFLPPSGMSFCLLGRNTTWVEDVAAYLEEAMPGTTLTIYANSGNTDNTHWAWSYQQMMVADFVLVDCHSATQFDQIMAMASYPGHLWWVNSDGLSEHMASLLHATGAKTADNIHDFFELFSHGPQ